MTVADTEQRVPAVGDTAPDLTLPSTSGEKVTLSSFRGKSNVLLAFFPLAFTSTCTAELCAFSDDWDALAATGTVVLPLSVDSIPTLKEFKAKHAMKADLLSDFRRDVSRRYGVLREDTFFSQRAYFLVDRDGIVRWAHVEETPGQRRENREILERIAALG
jgi:peroxiredoxin